MEVDELKQRFEAAVAEAISRGASHESARFADAMQRSVAVINCDIHFLHEFMSDDRMLYGTYHQGVRSAIRKAATLENDRERRGVDAIMFGEMGEHIVTAALSLSCRGLRSYGPYCIQLREVAVAKRASLLETNAFLFVRKHNLQPNKPLPVGYQSDWPSRYKLACAKLLHRVKVGMDDSDFQDLLLYSTGHRQKDEFIEVHIYRGFDNRAVEKISGPRPTGPVDTALWAVVEELAINAGKIVEVY